MSAGFPAAPPGLFPSFTNANNGGSAQPTFSTGSYFYPPQVNGDNKPRLKLKRTRQRVDAGEPRNTYNNIAGYTPGRVAPSPFGAPSTGAALYNPSSFGTSPEMGGPQTPQQNYFRSVYDNVYGAVPGYWSMPYFHSSLRPPAQNAVDGAAPSTAVGCKREAESDEKLANDAKGSEEADDDSTLEDSEYEVRQKKARVENIITTIQPGPTGSVEENGCSRKDVAISPDGGSRVVGSEGTPKSKRKQYQPQQLDFVADDNDAGVERDSANRDEADDEEFEADDSLGDDEVSDEKSADHATDGANCAAEGSHMKTEIKRMRSEIFVMQQRYMEMFASQQKRYASFGAAGVVPPPAAAPSVDDVPAEGKVVNADDDFKGDKDLKSLAEGLKSELVNAVNGAVDKILGAYSRAEAERVRRNDQRQQQQEQQRRMAPAPRPPFYFPPFYYNPTGGLPLASNFAVSNAAAAHSIFPHYGGATPGTANAPFLHNFGLGLPPSGPKIVADEACVGFGANRKKRSKVTDTRVSKVPSLRNEDQQTGAEGSPTGFGAYPSMVSQQTFRSGDASFNNNSLDDSDLGAASPDNSDGSGSETAPYDPNTPQSTTLTPMHLRKAKLMFFYTRYPSSALLKAYFPDIRFNKNNTAQLVKWFSNFREFYYIQMEKYARQALAEGSVRSADEIQVCVDSELYKVLNLHYNRNNHIQVPPSFRRVIEATLREFFGAVQSGRDAEPSWKKAIYKIIARLDEQIPEYFKTPNFLEQLE